MKADTNRIKSYLLEIRRSAVELKELADANALSPASLALKAAKYLLIELAEAMSNTIQHILAKEKGVAVSGYVDAIAKAREHEIVSEDLFQRLKPFFDFRNSLIHRYWAVDDEMLIDNIKEGRDDFERFIAEVNTYLEKRL